MKTAPQASSGLRWNVALAGAAIAGLSLVGGIAEKGALLITICPFLDRSQFSWLPYIRVILCLL